MIKISIENWMLKHIVPTNSMLFHHFQRLSEEIFCVFTEIGIYFYWGVLYWLNQLILWSSSPRSASVKHFIIHTSNWPNVTLRSISHTLQHLNWHVEWSAHTTLIFKLLMDIGFCKPEITNFKWALTHQNVSRFQIPK